MRSSTADPIAPVMALLGGLEGEIEVLLERFRIAPHEAEEVLRDLLLLLAVRWERLESREMWALATVKRHCLRRALRRAAAAPDA